MFKLLFDKTLALLLIIIFLPVMIVVALLTYFSIGLPIFFHQERPGYKGKMFIIHKFRTMTDSRDKNGKLLPDEQRLIRIGKLIRSLSLDELPQLFNVLKGDMSLVGPRPLLMDISLCNKEQMRRYDVKPGMTGWAQINGRNNIGWEDKFKFDIWYIDNWSFWLDIKILLITIKKVLRKEGIK